MEIDKITTPIIDFLLNPDSGILKSIENEKFNDHIEYQQKKEITKKTIFLSYSTKDFEIFKINEISGKLAEFKEIESVLYWQEDMRDNIYKYMSDNLGKCDVMILFCSPNALKSKPVEKEWTAADALDKPIIPIFIKEEHIPHLLKSRRGIEYDTFDLQKNIENIYKLILKKTEKPI